MAVWLVLVSTALGGVGEPPVRPQAAPQSVEDKPGSIASKYRESAQRIIRATMAGNDAFRKLEMLCVDIGNRLSGSRELFKATEWAMATMVKDGQENVRRQKVMVPHWARRDEWAAITTPRLEPMAMLGLGGSVGTGRDPIHAQVVVVRDKEELERLGDAARGKIVLFNVPMPEYDPQTGSGYGTAVAYRINGAAWASSHGAVAALVRSATARSLRTPHTGVTIYDADNPKIPAAAISVEDAEMIASLYARSMPVKVKLKMEAMTYDDAPSANIIGELRGSTLPEEIVVIGGHLDSWDVGQGAHDDGGGCVMAMEAINVLRKLNMVPRRTIRVVLWTNEENGSRGAKAYASEHAEELSRHVAAIEADSGVFQPTGYSMECADARKESAAAAQLGDLLTLLSSLGPMEVHTGHSGSDVGPMRQAGVVLMGHNVEGSRYFDYHHSQADTIDKVNPEDLSRNVAALATVAYIIADMPARLGNNE